MSAPAAVLRLVLAAACWGLAAVFAKHAFEHAIPPARMAEARVALSLALLAPALAWSRPGWLRPPPGALPLLTAFGACMAAVNFTYYVAVDHLGVGTALALEYTGVVLVPLAGVARKRRAPHPLTWAAAAATVVGAALVSRALDGLGGMSAAGVVAGLASAGLFAAYLLLAEAAGARGVPPGTTLLWGLAVATAAWTLAAPWWSWPYGRLADLATALAVLGAGVVGTLVPFSLVVSAVRAVSATTAGICATAEPAFGAAFAWLLLGERLSAAQVAGSLLVVAGVVLGQLAAGREAATLSGTFAGSPAEDYGRE